MTSTIQRAVPAAVLAVLTACGQVGQGGGGVDSDAGGGNARAAGATELSIEVQTGQGESRTYTLRCDPPGGSHPDPQAACRLLEKLEDAFAPVPAGTICTEVYGGPQTAKVTGTLRGDPVDAEFSRVDGCQIARWDKHLAILVDAGGVDRT